VKLHFDRRISLRGVQCKERNSCSDSNNAAGKLVVETKSSSAVETGNAFRREIIVIIITAAETETAY
jgi:hypothetical protein